MKPKILKLILIKEHLHNYQLGLDINSRALKNKIIEVNTNLRFENKQNQKKTHFELTYTTVIKIDENIKEKEELEKILLCDLQIKIYPDLEKSLLNLLHNSGYTEVKFDKKIDFENYITIEIIKKNFSLDFFPSTFDDLIIRQRKV